MKPTAQPVRIHKDGFFRFSRNPMYLGITIGLFGIAILLGSMITFVFPILFFIIMNFVFVPHEEKILQATFGDDFLSYRQEVPRWFGFSNQAWKSRL
jgi:protein-S-isoprenylcysteine O-methyltransferase Ste14